MVVQKVINSRLDINQELLPKLVKLGFTKQEALVYLILVKEGTLPAKEIALRMKILPHAVYRIIKRLEGKKLVVIVTSSPLNFYVLPPELALSAYVKQTAVRLEKEAVEVSQSLIKGETHTYSTKINILSGKQALFEDSEILINKAKKEVLVISIGEPSTGDLILANRRAIERGVIIRMVAHKHNPENQEFLANLQKNGLEVRYFPDSGFHILIVDTAITLLAVSDPQNSEERVTIKMFNTGLSQALRDYFYSVWEKAIEV